MGNSNYFQYSGLFVAPYFNINKYFRIGFRAQYGVVFGEDLDAPKYEYRIYPVSLLINFNLL